jgi:hypothetical protein
MATLPIHTVQHIKSVYNKYQVIAAVFTALTLLAALLAAVSGFQLAKLRKTQPADMASSSAKAEKPAPAPVDPELQKEVERLRGQLQSEKTASQTLRAKVNALEEKIATMKVAMQSLSRPEPKKPETPVKPQIPKVAPTTETPKPVRPAEGKSSAPAAATVPTATPKPAAKPLQDKENRLQPPPDMPASPGESKMTEEPGAESEPPDAQTSTLPSGAEVVTEQTAEEPAAVPAPATSTDGMRQTAPQETGDGPAIPSEPTAQPATDPDDVSPTVDKP